MSGINVYLAQEIEGFRKSYPGHLDPEICDYSVVNDEIQCSSQYITNEKCIELARGVVKPGCIQLIRFRPNDPSKPTTQMPTADIDTVLKVLDICHFPVRPVVSARHDIRLQVAQHHHKDIGDDTLIVSTSGMRFCAMWTADTKTSSVRAVIINFMPSNTAVDNAFHIIFGQLFMSQFQSCFTHPMFLALPIIRMIQADTMGVYTKDAVNLRVIENSFVTNHSAGRLQTMQTLRDLGHSASRDKYILLGLKTVLKFSHRIHEHCWDSQNSKQNASTTKSFLLHAAQLEDYLEVDIAFMTSIAESVANQQAAQTSIINLRDNSSLRTITLITMTFLPATFVASLFSMSMFQWNEDEDRIVSKQFWIYWAVVVPLTLFVFAIWLGWQRLSSAKEASSTGSIHESFGLSHRWLKKVDNKSHKIGRTETWQDRRRISQFDNDFWKGQTSSNA